MQIRKVTVGCFLSATIVLVGVLWTLVVKNIELQKNSLLDNEEIQTIESETGWQQQGSDWYYYDESGNPVQNEWVEQYYYIGEDGKMVRNQYVDRFFVSQYGNWNPRFEAPYWLMHGEWKKNGNVWIYQYNGIVQTMDFSQIRSICRLIRAMKRHHQSKVKKRIAWQLKKVLQSCCVIYVLRRIMFPYVFMMSISIELPEIRVDRN